MARTKDSAPVDPKAKATKDLEVVTRRVERLRKKYERATQDATESKAALDLAVATQTYLSQHPALSLDTDTAQGVQDAYDEAGEDEGDEDEAPM